MFQVHLETNPSEFEFDETKFAILKQSERTRIEIFTDLLHKYLDIEVQVGESQVPLPAGIVFKQAYFLGRHEVSCYLLCALPCPNRFARCSRNLSYWRSCDHVVAVMTMSS